MAIVLAAPDPNQMILPEIPSAARKKMNSQNYHSYYLHYIHEFIPQ